MCEFDLIRCARADSHNCPNFHTINVLSTCGTIICDLASVTHWDGKYRSRTIRDTPPDLSGNIPTIICTFCTAQIKSDRKAEALKRKVHLQRERRKKEKEAKAAAMLLPETEKENDLSGRAPSRTPVKKRSTIARGGKSKKQKVLEEEAAEFDLSGPGDARIRMVREDFTVDRGEEEGFWDALSVVYGN